MKLRCNYDFLFSFFSNFLPIGEAVTMVILWNITRN